MSATPTQVVHVKDGCDVYIGRAMPGREGSVFANPYHIGADGTRDEVIDKYEVYITKRLAEEPELCEALERMRGKRIGCWCAPRRCHGHVLVRILEGPPPEAPPPAQFSLF
jgi:hypothetical protein